MTRKPENSIIGQEALLAAHPESGLMTVNDIEHNGQVGIAAQRLHELNVLSLFSAINQREMFYSYQQDVALERYGDNAEQVLAGSKRNRDVMQEEAREEYYRSRGVPAILQNAHEFPDFNVTQYLTEVKHDWGVYQARYRSTRHSEARANRAQALRADVLLLTAQENRSQEVRQFITMKEQKVAKAPSGREYPKLTSRERVVALVEEDRAGYLVKNDREKITAFTFMDYLDNPEYPLGVTNQLIEVFIRQQKGRSTGKLLVAQKSVISITHEIHDHYMNAIQSGQALLGLEQDLDGASPRLMLTDDVMAEHPGVAPLIRFRDIMVHIKETAPVEYVANPLKAIEDRRPHEDTTKNKTVADQYTAVNRTHEMDQYIAAEAGRMSIREARQLLKLALKDEAKRQAFWHDRLQELSSTLQERESLPVARLAGRLLTQDIRASQPA